MLYSSKFILVKKVLVEFVIGTTVTIPFSSFCVIGSVITCPVLYLPCSWLFDGEKLIFIISPNFILLKSFLSSLIIILTTLLSQQDFPNLYLILDLIFLP